MTDETGAGPRDAVRQALVEIGAGAGDLASVTRPLLEALRSTTGLELTYLASIDWERQVQRVEAADNAGDLPVGEGAELPWAETLCRRAMETDRYVVADVPATWGDHRLAHAAGIHTYVSAPVVLADGEVYGTICGVSTTPTEVSEQTQALLAVFSRLVADTVARERQLQRASERAEHSDRLLKARAEFVAAAQHRLKTPLTVIEGWAALLLDDGNPVAHAERSVALEAIRRAAANAIAEVSSMLAESETESLARDVSIGPVDVVELATTCARDLAGISGRHRIEVQVEGQTPPARSDRKALRIVLEHLVENAVKYSPDGGAVRISAGTSDAGRVRLSIRDEGIGLPVGVDIFAPFTRGTRQDIPGSGLGLHVVQSLVHAVGGVVTAQRNGEGPGSTMTVLLPPAVGV